MMKDAIYNQEKEIPSLGVPKPCSACPTIDAPEVVVEWWDEWANKEQTKIRCEPLCMENNVLKIMKHLKIKGSWQNSSKK